tara:strand:- start:898 stop:1224 length:327 start_codon:yes stop_codon:yes gene_type:complete
MKEEMTLETWTKLIQMMRSSNMEDFFLGLELYKNMKRSRAYDLLLIKSFGGEKRREIIVGIKHVSKVHAMFMTLESIKDQCITENEKLIFKNLEDEYSNYKSKSKQDS